MCEYWKLKTKIWNLYVKCLEFENLTIKMFELRCVNISNWNFYVKRLEFENLKIEMSKFGCVHIESWKLRIEIFLWNVWKEFENLKIEMSKYWKLKCLNIEN